MFLIFIHLFFQLEALSYAKETNTDCGTVVALSCDPSTNCTSSVQQDFSKNQPPPLTFEPLTAGASNLLERQNSAVPAS